MRPLRGPLPGPFRCHLRGKTFATKREAQQYLDRTGTAMVDQAWRDPALGKVKLEEYTGWWLDNRPDLRPRTRVH